MNVWKNILDEEQLYDYDPDYVVAPSECLAEWLQRAGVSASWLDSQNRKMGQTYFQDVLDRKPLTPEHARALHYFTRISAQFWLNFEHNYRVGLAAGKEDVSDLGRET